MGLLPEIWPKCLPIIEKVCEHNRNIDSPENIYSVLENGKKQLWLAVCDNNIIGLVVTCIETYPNQKICSIDICTGNDLDEWIHNLPTIESWAKEQGCGEMFFTARIGYERKLKEFDYNKTHIFLQKVLK